jgi:two-component system, LuxR family, sensor kinase FixL
LWASPIGTDRTRLWRDFAATVVLGGAGLALLTVLGRLLHLNFETVALLHLIVVVAVSLRGSFSASLLVVAMAIAGVHIFFMESPFHLSGIAPLDAAALLAFSTTAVVVTYLVSRDRAARAAQQAQAELLDLSHDTVFVRDMNDVITYWNRSAERQYGWTRDEAVGQVTHALLRTVFPAPLADITAALTRDGHWEGELVHARRDGTRVVVSSRWSLQRDGTGHPAAILETNNDITGQRETAESLRRAQAELAHVARATTLGELAASIAHEVNQPLAAIVADANACLHWLAAASPPLDSVREALGAVVKDAERAAGVIARIRALLARTAVAHQPGDLNEIAADVLPLVRPELARHGIALESALAPGLPPVMADRVQLQQVLLNLLLNAVEAVRDAPTERRRIAMRSAVEREDDETWAVLAIEDTGVGFRESDPQRLFEAFYTTKPGGLGMGLSISRSIVDRHGGRLWATANTDHGATFHVALPAAS